jgi:hypothetical protein
MWGPSNASIEGKIPSRHRGITPRVFEQLFARIQEVGFPDRKNYLKLAGQLMHSFLLILCFLGFRKNIKMLKSNYIISVAVHSWRYIS